MSTKATVGLVVVLAVLCGAYWLVGRAQEAAVQQVVAAKRLFDFAAEDVTTVSLTRLGEGPVDGVRGKDGSWSIAVPYPHIPANEVVWERVSAALAGLLNERTLEDDPPDLAAYGLDEPLLKVIVGTRTGRLAELAFGGVDPTEMYRYAVVDGGPVILTPMKDFRELDRPLADLRNRHLFDIGEAGITRIEFALHWAGDEDANGKKQGPDRYVPQSGDESVVVVMDRTLEGVWRLSQPVEAAAEQEPVKALATELQFAMGRGHVDAVESLSDYGLRFPGARITVYSGVGSVGQTLMLGWISGGEEGGLFVKRQGDPSVFVIDAHLLTLIPDSPQAFRDKHLFSGEAKRIRRIDYTEVRDKEVQDNEDRDNEDEGTDGQDHRAFSLELDPKAGWRLVEPLAEDTDQRAVSRFLSLLKNTEGVAFSDETDAAVLGLDTPRISIQFSSDEGPPGSILVGAQVPDTDPPLHYARRQDSVVMTLSDRSVENLRWERFSFRKKALLSFVPAEARELSVDLDGTRYVMKRVEGRWVVSEPEGRKLESQSDVAGLLEVFANTLAKGMADSRPGAEIDGLDAPILSATVGLSQPSEGAVGEAVDPREVAAPLRVVGPLKVGHIAADEGRNRFATVAGRSGVYFVDQALIDDVREALRGVVPR